jgi:predicted transcriptional regulator
MNEFKNIAEQTGLKAHKIAELLSISIGSVYSYTQGRRVAPKGIIKAFKEINEVINGGDRSWTN